MNNRVVPELEILTVLLDRTSKSIIVNVQPHPVQRPFWQASLFHLPPKFTSTVKKRERSSGTVLKDKLDPRIPSKYFLFSIVCII